MSKSKIILLLILAASIITPILILHYSNQKLENEIIELKTRNTEFTNKIQYVERALAETNNNINNKLNTFNVINPEINRLNATVTTLKLSNSKLNEQLSSIDKNYKAEQELIKNTTANINVLCEKRAKVGYPCQ